MQREFLLSREFVSWAAEVRQGLQHESAAPAGEEHCISLPVALYEELSAVLLGQESTDGSDEPLAYDDGHPLLAAIDQSLARWQANITVRYSQASGEQLEHYLLQSQQLLRLVEQREIQLERRERELEQRLAETLTMQAKLIRQRRSVANQLRAQKAEAHLEIERQRRSLRATDDSPHSLVTEANDRSERSREYDELQSKLEQLRAELEATELENGRLRDELSQVGDNEMHDRDALHRELIELRARLAELELAEANQTPKQDSEAAATSHRNELQALQIQLDQAYSRIAEYESLMESDGAIDAEGMELTRLLNEVRDANDDLQSQNADLAAQLAKQQVSGASRPNVKFDQESLSWEERKKLIMQQLEDDDLGQDSDAADQSRTQIERILATTQAEIARRDREIEGLQAIIEQQADTRQGVAIGAAAIAQMLDSDELVKQERQKLKEIQQEWEEKLRRSEIDISMERAKLARERSKLEAQLAELTQGVAAQPEPSVPETGNGRTRKWLEHLGLKDDTVTQR